MNRLAKLTFTELKLFLRDPTAVFFAVVFPPMLLGILGASLPSANRARIWAASGWSTSTSRS